MRKEKSAKDTATIRVFADDHRRLKMMAARKGGTVQNVIKELVKLAN